MLQSNKFIDDIFNSEQYKYFRVKFRNCWDLGPKGANDGIFFFNKMLKFLHEHNSFTIKELIHRIYLSNSDLPGLVMSKLVSYLDEDNRRLYKNSK